MSLDSHRKGAGSVQLLLYKRRQPDLFDDEIGEIARILGCDPEMFHPLIVFVGDRRHHDGGLGVRSRGLKSAETIPFRIVQSFLSREHDGLDRAEIRILRGDLFRVDMDIASECAPVFWKLIAGIVKVQAQDADSRRFD